MLPSSCRPTIVVIGLIVSLSAVPAEQGERLLSVLNSIYLSFLFCSCPSNGGSLSLQRTFKTEETTLQTAEYRH